MKEDLISRAAAIALFDDYVCPILPEEVMDELRRLPAAGPGQRPLALKEIDENRPVYLQYRKPHIKGAHWRIDGWKPYGVMATAEARLLRYGVDFRAWQTNPTPEEAGIPWEEEEIPERRINDETSHHRYPKRKL